MQALELGGNDVDLLSIALEPKPDGFANYDVSLVWKGDGYWLETVSPTANRTIAIVDLSTARRMMLDLTLSASGSSVSMKRDGVEVASMTLPAVTSKGETVKVGLPYVDSTTSLTSVRADDVLVDVE